MEGLHTGNWDAIIVEVIKYIPNWNHPSPMEKLRHEKHQLAILLEQYKRQRLDHILTPPKEDGESEGDPKEKFQRCREPNEMDGGPEGEAPALSNADQSQKKEAEITKERMKHAQTCMEETVTLTVGPLTKEAMKQIMQQHFIAHRDKTERSRFGRNTSLCCIALAQTQCQIARLANMVCCLYRHDQMNLVCGSFSNALQSC